MVCCTERPYMIYSIPYVLLTVFLGLLALLHEKYKDDPRFTFMRFEDRGHNEIFNDPANTYKDEFNAEFDKWLETLGYDYKAEENKARFVEDKAGYITEHLDHAEWSDRLDEELFSQFLEFYDNAIK